MEKNNFGCRAFIFFFLSFIFYYPWLVFANNLAITDGEITAISTSSDTATIQFDIAWDNSWRDATNYDAAWVFVKFHKDVSDGTAWSHVTLKTSGTTPAGFSTGSDGDSDGGDTDAIEIVVPTDKTGCFIQRSSNNTGTLDRDSVQIVWDYSADSVSDAEIENVSLKIFGIEMCYIPESSFYLGDTESDYGQFEYETDGTTFQVTSEGSITLGGDVAGSLGNNNATGMSTADDFNDSTSQTLPATFPKGYDDFYLMKYELSQGQYRDFLNTLTHTQQGTRVAATLDGDEAGDFVMVVEDGTLTARQTITAAFDPADPDNDPYTFGCDLDDDNIVDEEDDGEWIAMNYMSWMDGCAYADWAGLRPMTELEFEKACRGPLMPVADEYAWGTATIAASAYTLANSGEIDEEIDSNYSTVAGNALYTTTEGSIDGPIRVGAFAGDTSNDGTRMVSGAGYYGNMELSGNLYERTVTLGNATGRAFLGTHGDGSLSSDGNATNPDWPGYSAGEVTGATGAGFRGGGWGNFAGNAQVSYRSSAAITHAGRSNHYGFRLVRQGF
ncbi:MAG: SUMF1/EgtB/PvdO family nonheme iron enzyme [Candidatus Omnitrophica bacterium]|nr:SUMF1/EgtB/PvdO family nonheme iron enzyme [Candidatus Omnitrophota bacterium]